MFTKKPTARIILNDIIENFLPENEMSKDTSFFTTSIKYGTGSSNQHKRTRKRKGINMKEKSKTIIICKKKKNDFVHCKYKRVYRQTININ